MRRAYDRLVAILEIYSAVLILVMLGVVLVGVFYRYVVDQALSWYDEFAGYILVWLTMYGSVVGLARGKHISFETVVEKFPRRGQRTAAIFAILCVLSFSLVVLLSGWQLIIEMGGETAISIPELKMAWIYSVMPISAALMVLVGVVQVFSLLMGGEVPGGVRPKAMEEGQ
ncbi:MAG TPA: TRAP transporter small permease [Candidatus Methylomirabilis sp.]|nr:TRAP transporter small permease [Candidatus Methylomirabilis sp.]HSC72499.1 TRAP transporter small permease [Candidatus Methylomirabilis sp.]